MAVSTQQLAQALYQALAPLAQQKGGATSQQIGQALSRAISSVAGGTSGTGVGVPPPPKPVSLTSGTPTPSVSVSTPQPSGGITQPKTSVPSTTLNVQTSLVDYLKSIGQPSDFASRAQLAQQYGITDYRGTAEQNIALLNILRNQPTSSISKPSSSPSQSTISQSQSQIQSQPQLQQQPQSYTYSQISQPQISQSQAQAQDQAQTQPQSIQNLDTLIENKLNALLDKYLQPIDYSQVAQQAISIAREMNRPVIEAFEGLKNTLLEQFRLAKEDLNKQHQQEKERLIGSWADRGFSPNEPVVQRALQELEQIQEKERQNLESKQAQSLAELGYQTMKIEPSTVASIMSSILTTERTGVASGSVLDLLEKVLQERERRITREEERKAKEQPQIQTEIRETEDGVYLITYSVDPKTGETKVIARIKIGEPKRTQPTLKSMDIKDVFGNPVERIWFDPTTGEIIRREAITSQQPTQSSITPIQQQKSGNPIINWIKGLFGRKQSTTTPTITPEGF